MIRSLALVLALASLASCKKSEEAKPAPAAKVEPAPATAPAQPAQAAADFKAVCVQTFQKSRACTNDFIPALVDSRAKYDVPKGIADKVKADRNAIVAEAMKEWENDSKDEAITANCDKMPAPPADAVAAAQTCLAKADCKEFTACIMPVMEKQFAK